jgi:acetylornithine deacetylase
MSAPGTVLADVELLGRLVAFDSTSSRSNLPLADFICDYLDGRGATIERVASADGAKVNLLVRVGPEVAASREGLILSGHLDTVPAGEEGWQSDPFRLTERDGRCIGRGACDMKGFIALAVNLAASQDPARMRAPLVLLLTYDEEVGSLGAQRLAQELPERGLPRAAVIGEPTSLRVVRMHKGHLRVRLTLHGESAHSAFPGRGASAIEPAGPLLCELAALGRTLQSERPPMGEHFPEAPYVVLNVGRVCGGTAVNVVPDRCTIELGLRPLPGMDAEPLLARVRQATRNVPAASRLAIDAIHYNPPLLEPEDSPIHRQLCALAGQPQSFATPFASDAGVLQQMGLSCVLFGPGAIEVAHRPNEWLPRAELSRARALLERLVDARCVAGPS